MTGEDAPASRSSLPVKRPSSSKWIDIAEWEWSRSGVGVELHGFAFDHYPTGQPPKTPLGTEIPKTGSKQGTQKNDFTSL